MTQSSPLDLTFFGLTLDNAPGVRVKVFSTIHEIVFNGKGGYDWETVYNMPIWLRKFTFNKLKSYYDEVEEIRKKSNKGNSTQIDLNNPTKSRPPKSTSPPSYISKRTQK
jgi:hypothetical protein